MISLLETLVFVPIVWVLAILILVFTFLPMWNTNIWWVRILDFPRLQIVVAAVMVLVISAFLPRPSHIIIPVLMVAASGYQLWWIFPYTPFATAEMKLSDNAPDQIKVLSSNVLMENKQHDLLEGVIKAFDPDILLLMETDQTWVDAIEPVLARYSTVIREPRNDHYGMVFATRLEVDEVRIVHLTASDTPSVFAQMTGPDGTTFRFVGLHPRPPVPGQSTQERDAQIYYAAKFAAKSGVPLITTGDFNDVAWSDTSQSFKHVGQYLDPRIGRGFFASFDANKPYLRFPIDQLYVTANVVMVSIERLGYVGSDHFPMAATIRLGPVLAAELNISPATISEEEQELIDSTVASTRRILGHETP